MGDKYFVDLRMPADQLPAAHDAVLACTLGRAPSAPLHTYTGANGRTEMAVGPEFTTVRMTKPSLCSLLATSEVTTVKTSDISHLRAALPSWQNALIKAIRDIELVKLSRALTALSGEDLVTVSETTAAAGYSTPFSSTSCCECCRCSPLHDCCLLLTAQCSLSPLLSFLCAAARVALQLLQ